MSSHRPMTCTWKRLIFNEALAVIVVANVGCHVAVGDLSDFYILWALFAPGEGFRGPVLACIYRMFCGMLCCSGRWFYLTLLFGDFLRHFQWWSFELEHISELLCHSTDSRKAFSSGKAKSDFKASRSSSSALAIMQFALLLFSRCKHPSLCDYL